VIDRRIPEKSGRKAPNGLIENRSGTMALAIINISAYEGIARPEVSHGAGYREHDIDVIHLGGTVNSV
jgi:hypothetical protein